MSGIVAVSYSRRLLVLGSIGSRECRELGVPLSNLVFDQQLGCTWLGGLDHRL